MVSSFLLRISYASGPLEPEQLIDRLIAARPVDDPMFDREQQPVEQQTHDANRQNTDEDVVRAEEPSGVQDHPTESRTSRNDLGGDESRIDDADGKPRASEDLVQRRGKYDVPEDLPLGRTH